METRIERIENDVETINSFTSTRGNGFTRFTFSEEYGRARSYLIEELKRIGAGIFTTPGGNLRGRLEGSEPGTPCVMMGSHLDSVLHGGKYDGVAGVVSALEAARVMVEEKVPHRHPVDVIVFAEEEGSRFGAGLIGSRAWTGQFALTDLKELRDRDGTSYLAAMERSGILPDDRSVLKVGDVKAMIELHIEQGAVLEKNGRRIGVVEGIAGIRQFLVTIHGVSNHAGGTPMGLRHDALQGAVRIIARVDELAARELGENTVATVGYMICEPGQFNIIPGKVQFSLDVRDPDAATLAKAIGGIAGEIERICRDRGLTFEMTPKSDIPPVALSGRIASLIETLSGRKGVRPLRMSSGALHDSSILAAITEAGMIFVPSREGRSHCPEEFTDSKDIKLGADVLLDAVAQLSH
jgi:allantoate deiminase